MALLGVGHFGMELHRHQRAGTMRDRSYGASGCGAQDIEAFGRRCHLVAMVHPHLQLAI